MSRSILFAIALALGAPAAQGQSAADGVIQQLQDQGFTRIEVQNGRTQTKVEAIRGGRKTEIVFDRRTGDILKQETERATSRERALRGVEVRDRPNRDFVRGADASVRSGDDRGRGRGRDDDDGRHGDDDDDHGGRRGGDDHAGGHGADDGSNGGDDHGGNRGPGGGGDDDGGGSGNSGSGNSGPGGGHGGHGGDDD